MIKLIRDSKIKTQGMASNNFIISIKDYNDSPELTVDDIKDLISKCKAENKCYKEIYESKNINITDKMKLQARKHYNKNELIINRLEEIL